MVGWGLWSVIPNTKVHGANMGLTWVLSAPDEPHVGPMNLAIRDVISASNVSISPLRAACETYYKNNLVFFVVSESTRLLRRTQSNIGTSQILREACFVCDIELSLGRVLSAASLMSPHQASPSCITLISCLRNIFFGWSLCRWRLWYFRLVYLHLHLGQE